jgi:ATP-dependent RNA helicase RhlE
MALLPPAAKRQNLLFSATFSGEIKKLADELLNQPQLIEVARRNTAAETVDQSAYKVPQEDKRALLVHLVKSRNYWQVLCFVRTKHGASRLARQLEKDGLTTSAIHGDKTQAARLEALTAFKDGKLQVLVATDVAARGLDIDHLPVVMNYELPHVPEDYIHRIGRTGRAGASGVAISLVDPAEEKYLAEIERLLKKKVLVHQPENYAVEKAAARAHERSPRPERAAAGDRAPRGERAERTTRRGAGEQRPERTSHEERMREREEAYARNPDQPLAASGRAATVAALGGSGTQRHAATSRPVPMLLQRRKPVAPPVAEGAAAPIADAPASADDAPQRTPDALAPAA